MSEIDPVGPIAVVVGNPRAASRTRDVAVATAVAVAEWAGHPADVTVIDLADLSPAVLAWGDEGVASAKRTVLESRLLVVASPVYKASYTGLLKAFLDQFGRDELQALATVPVMVGAGEAHQLAVEHQLRPVLIEIGASCPTRGVYVQEGQLDDLDTTIDAWLSVWGDVLVAAARAPR